LLPLADSNPCIFPGFFLGWVIELLQHLLFRYPSSFCLRLSGRLNSFFLVFRLLVLFPVFPAQPSSSVVFERIRLGKPPFPSTLVFFGLRNSFTCFSGPFLSRDRVFPLTTSCFPPIFIDITFKWLLPFCLAAPAFILKRPLPLPHRRHLLRLEHCCAREFFSFLRPPSSINGSLSFLLGPSDAVFFLFLLSLAQRGVSPQTLLIFTTLTPLVNTGQMSITFAHTVASAGFYSGAVTHRRFVLSFFFCFFLCSLLFECLILPQPDPGILRRPHPTHYPVITVSFSLAFPGVFGAFSIGLLIWLRMFDFPPGISPCCS